MTVLQKRQIEADIFPEKFQSVEKLVAFPLRNEDQLLGATMIACPGDCKCVTKELDVITKELEPALLRKLIGASIPLWKKRGTEDTICPHPWPPRR